MMLINVFNYNIRSDLNMEMDKTQSQLIVVASRKYSVLIT